MSLPILMCLLIFAGCDTTSPTRNSGPAKNGATRPLGDDAKTMQARQTVKPVEKEIVSLGDLPKDVWSPEADKAEHLRYHWPPTFELPIEIVLTAPEVPANLQNPSQPIEPAK